MYKLALNYSLALQRVTTRLCLMTLSLIPFLLFGPPVSPCW
jgi:hypothetical protein